MRRAACGVAGRRVVMAGRAMLRARWLLAALTSACDTAPTRVAAPCEAPWTAGPSVPAVAALPVWRLETRTGVTVAEEQFDGASATVVAVRRLPRARVAQRLAFVVDSAPRAVYASAPRARWEFVATHGDDPARTTRQRLVVRGAQRLVLHGTPLGGVVTVDTIDAPANVMPWLDGSPLVLEQVTRCVRAGGVSACAVPVLPLTAPARRQTVQITRGDADTVHVAHPDARWWVRVDARGRLLEAADAARGLRLAPVCDAARVHDAGDASRAAPFADDRHGVHGASVIASDGSRAIEVALRAADGTRLGGTLVLPSSALATAPDARWPAVLFLSGAGPQTRDLAVAGLADYAPFAELAAVLAADGIASLRLDDRGVGASGGGAFLHDRATALADARVALAWLQAHPAIDAGAVALVGHSDGGVRALQLAAASTPDPLAPSSPPVRAVVTLGAPARSGRALAAWQRAQWPRPGGERPLADRPSPPTRAPADTSVASDDVVLDALAQRDPWVHDWFAGDPARTVSRAPRAVLLLHGERDTQVPSADAMTLAALLRARAPADAHITPRILPAVDHLMLPFSPGDTGSDGARRAPVVAPRVASELRVWLRAALR